MSDENLNIEVTDEATTVISQWDQNVGSVLNELQIKRDLVEETEEQERLNAIKDSNSIDAEEIGQTIDDVIIDLYNIDLPALERSEAYAQFRDQVSKLVSDEYGKLGIDLTNLEQYGVNEDEFMSQLLITIGEITALSNLPPEVQNVIAIYSSYNTVEQTQELLRQYYEPGDAVSDVLVKFIDKYKVDNFGIDLYDKYDSQYYIG